MSKLVKTIYTGFQYNYGSSTPSIYGDIRYFFKIYEDVDIEKNTSTITYEHWCEGYGGYEMGGTAPVVSRVQYLGTFLTKSGSVTIPSSNTYFSKKLGTSVVQGIAHDSETGKYTLGFQGSGTIGSQPYIYTSHNQIALTTIPRAFAISVSNFDIQNNPAIAIGITYENYTYNLSYSIGELKGTIATGQTITPYVWELEEDLKTQIKELMSNTNSMQMTISCDTYNGNTKVASTKIANCNVLISEKPVINSYAVLETIEVIKALTNSAYVVKDLSKLKFTINATAPFGTSIASYRVEVLDKTFTKLTNEITTENIGNIAPFKLIATDHRTNESEPQLVDLPFIDYVKAEYVNTECSVKRTTGNIDKVSVNLRGNFFNKKIATTENDLILGYKYRVKGDVEYTTGTTNFIVGVGSGNTFSATAELNETFDHNKNYEFVFTINDLIYVGSEMTKQVSSSQYIMFEHQKGVDFLNATILGKQVAKLEDIPSSKVAQNFVDGNKTYTSGTYMSFVVPDIDTTDGDVVFESNGLITINYVGLVKISANLWVQGSSNSSRPWISIRDYTNGKNITSIIDDTSSGYTSFTFPDVYINNEVAGTQYAFYVNNVTGSLTLNAGSGANNSYCNIQLL